jgi:pyruvate dehydrogenase E1 component
VAIAALKALADEGAIPPETVAKAIESYEIETERPDPWKV